MAGFCGDTLIANFTATEVADDFVESALLVATTLTVEGFGTILGAV
jgi:hypothetical protein